MSTVEYTSVIKRTELLIRLLKGAVLSEETSLKGSHTV